MKDPGACECSQEKTLSISEKGNNRRRIALSITHCILKYQKAGETISDVGLGLLSYVPKLQFFFGSFESLSV